MESNVWREKAPIHIDLTFDAPSEVADLNAELRTWSPSQGWSQLAIQFFDALQEAATTYAPK
jgi:hypothetical protein